ncbi:CDP-glycerol glycerophosphotransferase family protein [Litchfieldia alkalitelluris]|uniref:CDP-glycerol glycerophosphotransferase family protein n=1 Tax=Litchfieldia alkalitelluris TaxID=304268 RepID=UPI0009968C20|nr:CDP-glycerol glycerophosphotransferase family protein [Litchfieldia alkalitelluris]
MEFLRYLPTILAKYFVKLAYLICTLIFPVNPKKITFASYRAEELKGNLAYIYKEISYEYRDYSCHFLFKKYNSSFGGKVDYLNHMLKASYHIATSRYFFIDDYYFPVYAITPRKGSEVVQFWHAAGAFKKFGYSTIDKQFGPSEAYLKHLKIHSNYSKAIVSSSEVIPFYAEAFDMPKEQVLPLGLPRTDYFFDTDEHIETRNRFFEEYPELIGKKIMLYAPTFRGKSHYQSSFKAPIDFEALKKKLGNQYVVLVKLHPYMKSIDVSDEVQDFVYHIKDNFDTQELMTISDLLVTDYSSVVFDYSILLKPIAFLADDLESYLEERDFYYEFHTFIPGPFFEQTDEFADWVEKGDFDLNKVTTFRERFFDVNDGQASKRIVQALLSTEASVAEQQKLTKMSS